ncbi:hypothetical protein [Mycolicibacterium mucogenicum]|uniref:hypothetical protein n=1 Tax=Mycolicibacterium mucogenicum TaxID=56689 RepID=UPI00076A0033|nr:hypothetical protein [Mycolicibacterium mucogenicum]
MADLAALPWFLCKANYRGIVPDTLDVGIRPDQFRPWGECVLTPHVVDVDNKIVAGQVERRLISLTPPTTVLLTPITARIETGVLRLPRLPAPAGETDPPTPGEIAEQQTAEGVPLTANNTADVLELGTLRIAWQVAFGSMTILGQTYRFNSFYFLGPTVTDYDPDDEDWTPPEVDLTTVARFNPAPA